MQHGNLSVQSADAIHRTMAWHTNANNQGLVIEHTIALILHSIPSRLLAILEARCGTDGRYIHTESPMAMGPKPRPVGASVRKKPQVDRL